VLHVRDGDRPESTFTRKLEPGADTHNQYVGFGHPVADTDTETWVPALAGEGGFGAAVN